MICPFLRIATFKKAKPLLDILKARNTSSSETEAHGNVEEQVKDILGRVRTEGLSAVVEYTRLFDSPNFSELLFTVPPIALETAFARQDAKAVEMLRGAIQNIREFHERQKQDSWFVTRPDGSIFGQRVIPVDRAGIYVPGGKGGSTPLISSLLMGAIPAQVAGVSEIAVISPPGADGHVHHTILAAAHMLGIREVYAVGSAWGIGALAYGAGDLRPVDVIAGPGNIYVTTAKRLLQGHVGIDMIAGPSEILIIADESANPVWVAADMLSQAEHDPLASSICLCSDEKTAAAIHEELARQLEPLPRRDIAAKALQRYGAVAVVPSVDVAVEVTNMVAAEHLQLLVANPWEVMPRIRHAGAIFMGHYASEVLGDYYAGPNHVLPTMGTARFSSALGVDTFCKRSSILAPSETFARENAKQVAKFARLEALEGHARAALCRDK